MHRQGGRLPDALRHRLERSFGTDLSEVRLHRCGTARRITEELGTIACAVDGAILLGAEVPDAVLAHEVVHLLQARLPGAAPLPVAEEEAHRLAARALAGLPCRVSVPADGARPLCWEEAGHYYTVYFVALACGVPNDDAMRIAFWTQFPDEVSELDAVKAGIKMAVNGATTGMEIAAYQQSGGFFWSDQTDRLARRIDETERDNQVNLDVQKGLHCLTGGDCELESRKREEISRKASLERGFFEFGLSLHSFGDSFAHRNPKTGRMYAPFLGHALHTLAAKNGGELAKANDYHHPDGLTPDRGKNYEEYILRLHRLITFRLGRMQGTALLSAPRTAAALMRILDEKADPARQIVQIRMMAKMEMNIDMNRYTPETQEDAYFAHFAETPKPVAASQYHVDRGLQLARLWALG